jgi:monovalent cation:H+ antiporter-2, CPA2 family
VESAAVLIELGGVIVGLAVLARVAGRLGIPTIPLYLTAGLAFGRGGILPLVTTEDFVEIGAEIGLILLLFMLGLEYTARELLTTLRVQAPTAAADLVLNFLPGVIAGALLGWSTLASVVLGGVTYVSSSGIIAKVLQDFGRIGNRETPIILSVLVIEDLAMAIYLPILAALLIGGSTLTGVGTAGAAVAVVLLLLLFAFRVEVGLSRMIFSKSDEALLLTILGITLLMAGVAELFQVSAAVAALLVGIMLSGPAAEGARALLAPLRDLFAAIFFAFVGFSLDPSEIPPVLGTAIVLGVITAGTKFATGWWSAGRSGIGSKGKARAGATLIARGEFSIAVAGLAVASDVEPDLGPLAVSYVFLLAVIGPITARLADPIADRFLGRPEARAPETTDEAA